MEEVEKIKANHKVNCSKCKLLSGEEFAAITNSHLGKKKVDKYYTEFIKFAGADVGKTETKIIDEVYEVVEAAYAIQDGKYTIDLLKNM